MSQARPPARGVPGESVVVLGMHRSGTSAVTRVVNLLGPSLCREGDLLTGPGNPAGHWESVSLVAFNDRLLAAFGGTATNPAPMADGWESLEPAARLRGEAGAVFERAHPSPAWVWKDPRTCLTLPFWRAVWRSAPVAVFVHREPLEVALSLQRRDGLGRGHCLALWERHVRAALLGARGLPLAVVHFGELMADPANAVARLRADLADLGVRVPGDPGQAARFISHSLGTSRREAQRLAGSPDATGAQRRLLSVVGSLPSRSARFVPPDLGPESVTTAELLSAVRARDECRRRLERQPGLGVAVRQMWPALRKTAVSRLSPRAGAGGR